MHTYPGFLLNNEERATYRQEAEELYRKALDVMKHIKMELIQHADQISGGTLLRPTSLQSSSQTFYPKTTGQSKAGTDEEKEELSSQDDATQ